VPPRALKDRSASACQPSVAVALSARVVRPMRKSVSVLRADRPQVTSVPGSADDIDSEPPVWMLSPTSERRVFTADAFSRASTFTAPASTPRSTGERLAAPTSLRFGLSEALLPTDCRPNAEFDCCANDAEPSM
jgi:hypothetical protein